MAAVDLMGLIFCGGCWMVMRDVEGDSRLFVLGVMIGLAVVDRALQSDWLEDVSSRAAVNLNRCIKLIISFYGFAKLKIALKTTVDQVE
jgi:hypothetical protein